jgi:mono/diheme cytochrome c family protein
MARPDLPADIAHGEADETRTIHELHAPIFREKDEPRDGLEPVPPWMTIFYGILMFWAGGYMALYCGGFAPDVYNEKNFHYGPAAGAQAKAEDPLAVGKRLYTIHCAACHQATGEGTAGKIPPLAGSEWVKGSPAVPVRILLAGLGGPIEVRGSSYDGAMPVFGERLKDGEISAILSYVRQAWDNGGGAISPAQVAEVRKRVGQRGQPWTAGELKEFANETLPEEPAAKESAKASEPANSK